MYFEAFHHLNKHEMSKYGYYSPQKCRVFLETPVEQAAVDWAIDLNCLLLLYCSIFMHMQWLKCPSNFALTHTHTSVHRYTDTATMQRRPCSLMAMDTDTHPHNHPTTPPHPTHIIFILVLKSALCAVRSHSPFCPGFLACVMARIIILISVLCGQPQNENICKCQSVANSLIQIRLQIRWNFAFPLISVCETEGRHISRTRQKGQGSRTKDPAVEQLSGSQGKK